MIAGGPDKSADIDESLSSTFKELLQIGQSFSLLVSKSLFRLAHEGLSTDKAMKLLCVCNRRDNLF